MIFTSVKKPSFQMTGWRQLPNGRGSHTLKRVLIKHTGKGRSLGALIRNILITGPSTLAVMLPMSFIVVMKNAKGPEGLPSENCHNYIPYNAGDYPFAIISRKLQFIVFDIEKMIARYEMIKSQNCMLAGSLSWRA